jgi:hypothetical protein
MAQWLRLAQLPPATAAMVVYEEITGKFVKKPIEIAWR